MWIHPFKPNPVGNSRRGRGRSRGQDWSAVKFNKEFWPIAKVKVRVYPPIIQKYYPTVPAHISEAVSFTLIFRWQIRSLLLQHPSLKTAELSFCCGASIGVVVKLMPVMGMNWQMAPRPRWNGSAIALQTGHETKGTWPALARAVMLDFWVPYRHTLVNLPHT